MNRFHKMRKLKTSHRKPGLKLLPRQRSRILNVLRQSNQGKNIQVDIFVRNVTNDLQNDVALASPCHTSTSLHRIFHVNEQCGEIISVAFKDLSQCENESASSTSAMDVDNFNSSNIENNICPDNDPNNGSDGNSYEEENIFHQFKKSLATSFIEGNLTHTQGNIILKTLRSLPCLSYLPKDSRTLLNTPRESPIISKIPPGEYLHIGFEKALTIILQKTPSNLIPHILEVNWNTDGTRVNKSGYMQAWPIQCSVTNIANSKPEIIGVYKGPKKPNSVDLFLDQFIHDVLKVIDNGGVSFFGKLIPVTLRAFIADAPARSWVLNHFGHTSSNPCSKCKVVGIRCEDQMVFIGTDHRLRSDEEYSQLIDDNHHKGPSPLVLLPMGLVSQVPVEYMHLVCIGVAKKCLTAWITGKYGKKGKLSGQNQDAISKRLLHIARYCPREFARKPRPLADYKDYKATEGRQFTLYTGPVVLQGIMEKQIYQHFLLFHASIRALCNSSTSQTLLHFAKLALNVFVKKCPQIYKQTFLSYNVHALLHLVGDVERLGPLDSFSAFPYENNMTFFKKYLRKPHCPLQQLAYRLAEKEKHEKLKSLNATDTIKVFQRHNQGPLPLGLTVHGLQYKKLQAKCFFINTDSLGNRCFILQDLLICFIYNILQQDNSYYLVIKTFAIVEDSYDVGVPSSSIGMFKCSTLCNDFSVIPLNEVKAKCYLMPCWAFNNNEGSDSSIDEVDEPVAGKYIVSVLL